MASAAIVLIITVMTIARHVLRAYSLGLKPTLSETLLRDGISTAFDTAKKRTNEMFQIVFSSCQSLRSCFTSTLRSDIIPETGLTWKHYQRCSRGAYILYSYTEFGV